MAQQNATPVTATIGTLHAVPYDSCLSSISGRIVSVYPSKAGPGYRYQNLHIQEPGGTAKVLLKISDFAQDIPKSLEGGFIEIAAKPSAPRGLIWEQEQDHNQKPKNSGRVVARKSSVVRTLLTPEQYRDGRHPTASPSETLFPLQPETAALPTPGAAVAAAPGVSHSDRPLPELEAMRLRYALARDQAHLLRKELDGSNAPVTADEEISFLHSATSALFQALQSSGFSVPTSEADPVEAFPHLAAMRVAIQSDETLKPLIEALAIRRGWLKKGAPWTDLTDNHAAETLTHLGISAAA